MVECVDVRVDEEFPNFSHVIKDNDQLEEEEYEIDESQASKGQYEEEAKQQEADPLSTKTPSRNAQKNHPESQIIKNIEVRVQTRSKHTPHEEVALISVIEPKKFSQASTK